MSVTGALPATAANCDRNIGLREITGARANILSFPPDRQQERSASIPGSTQDVFERAGERIGAWAVRLFSRRAVQVRVLPDAPVVESRSGSRDDGTAEIRHVRSAPLRSFQQPVEEPTSELVLVRSTPVLAQNWRTSNVVPVDKHIPEATAAATGKISGSALIGRTASAIPAVAVLTQLPPLQAGVRRALGARGADIAFCAIDVAVWVMARRQLHPAVPMLGRVMVEAAGSDGATSQSIQPLLPRSARVSSRPIATFLRAVCFGLGDSPLGAILCLVTPPPLAFALTVASILAALWS